MLDFIIIFAAILQGDDYDYRKRHLEETGRMEEH